MPLLELPGPAARRERLEALRARLGQERPDFASNRAAMAELDGLLAAVREGRPLPPPSPDALSPWS